MAYSAPIAQVVGLSGAGIITGLIASFSLISVPTVAAEPADSLARLWKKFFDIGMSTMPPLAITCSACFGFLAYKTRHMKKRNWPISPSMLYASAAILLPTIVPYTRIAMWNTVQALEQKAAGLEGAPSDRETVRLLHEWGRMNLNRAILTGLSTVIVGVAALGR